MSEESAKQLPQEAAPEGPTVPATVRPPFDPETFARESDSQVAVRDGQSPSARPTAPPPPGVPQYRPELASGTMPSLASVGPDAVPQLVIAREDLEWFDLPKAARAVLVHVDGLAAVRTIGPRAGLALDAATAAFHDLERDGIVTLRR
jgi:hypothetical protein